MEQKRTELTHAGGVVLRKTKGLTEYLLVQASDDPDQWVLPKGHIEPGENPRHCAMREVREETGVRAQIQKKLRTIQYSLEGKMVTVQFYLMQAIEEGEPEDRRRLHKWLSLNDAIALASHTDSKDLLRLAAP